MHNVFKIIFVSAIAVITGCSSSKKTIQQKKILVFSATKGFRHNSISAGKTALLKMAHENNWVADTTEDAAMFTAASLKQYGVVVFLNTTGSILDKEQQNAFQNYIQSGGSFIGIHAAADTEHDWPWYNGLVGAYFESHPQPQEALYNVVGKDHPAVSFMQDTVRRLEEIYNFKSFKKNLVKVLVTVDENSYTGGKMPGYHPVAWYHLYNGGKAFYTAWGHRPEAFTEPLFLQHINGAITWALVK